jgi:hypothetical protein
MNDAGSNLDQDGSSSFLQTLKIFAVGLASALFSTYLSPSSKKNGNGSNKL